MSKRILTIFFSLALWVILAACAQAGSAPTSTPSAAPTKEPEAKPAAQSTAQPGCTVRTVDPTPNPTQEALLPSPSETDWIEGPADAGVTIIEYSDFQ